MTLRYEYDKYDFKQQIRRFHVVSKFRIRILVYRFLCEGMRSLKKKE